MHDLLGRPPLSEVADEIQRIADSVLAIDRPVLAPRIDLVELTACCHLEAALLDRGRPYHRIVRKNTASALDGTDPSSLVLFDEGMELDAQGIVLAPLHLTFDIGRDRPRKHAVVDIVTAAGCLRGDRSRRPSAASHSTMGPSGQLVAIVLGPNL